MGGLVEGRSGFAKETGDVSMMAFESYRETCQDRKTSERVLCECP